MPTPAGFYSCPSWTGGRSSIASRAWPARQHAGRHDHAPAPYRAPAGRSCSIKPLDLDKAPGEFQRLGRRAARGSPRPTLRVGRGRLGRRRLGWRTKRFIAAVLLAAGDDDVRGCGRRGAPRSSPPAKYFVSSGEAVQHPGYSIFTRFRCARCARPAQPGVAREWLDRAMMYRYFAAGQCSLACPR